MKKIFTLCAVAMAALSVSAQTTWDATSLMEAGTAAVKSGSFSSKACTMAYPDLILHSQSDILPATTSDGENWKNVTNSDGEKLTDYTINVKQGDVTMNFVATPNPDCKIEELFTYGLGAAESAATSNKSLKNMSRPFPNFIKIKSGNPSSYFVGWYQAASNDVGWTYKTHETYWSTSAKIPSKGAYASFDVASSGNLEVAIYVNRGTDAVYVLDVNSDGSYTTLGTSEITYNGYFNNYTTEFHKNIHPTSSYLVMDNQTKNFFGYLTIAAKAGHKYMILSPTTQIGIYGFTFPVTDSPEPKQVDPSAISAVNAENAAIAPVKRIENGRILIGNYNLAGQRVK